MDSDFLVKNLRLAFKIADLKGLRKKCSFDEKSKKNVHHILPVDFMFFILIFWDRTWKSIHVSHTSYVCNVM